MDLRPTSVQAAPRAAISVHVDSVSLVGFSKSDHSVVIDAFRSELAAQLSGRQIEHRPEADRWGALSVKDSTAQAVGRSAAIEIARRLRR